ncbi:hypothetical protein TIFTF001_026541 [Ficus carica]|uniref:Uncharacterized protein n=1 Tax=Ficus carica TaxID=3494 RepID=A0AA88IYV0_FICCA|nr:hypothetical protein TIFTF001_026541 [Ficus carica]
MTETNNQEEPALHASKRNKRDATSDVEPLDYPNKSLKLDSSDNQTPPIPDTFDGKSSATDAEIGAGPGEDGNDEEDDCEGYGSDDEEGEDDDDDDEEGDGEKSNNGEADRKGKGILRDDKGKGKLIVEEEEDDDDDDSDDDDSSDGGGSELDSDLSDDSLAEVDLDNVLPSRTRQRPVHPPPPGVFIANDLGNYDDDSDDSDA